MCRMRKSGRERERFRMGYNAKWTVWMVMWWWHIFAEIWMLLSSSSPPHQLCRLSFSFCFNVFITWAQIVVVQALSLFLSLSPSSLATFENEYIFTSCTTAEQYYYCIWVIQICWMYHILSTELWLSYLFRFNFPFLVQLLYNNQGYCCCRWGRFFNNIPMRSAIFSLPKKKCNFILTLVYHKLFWNVLK